MSTPTHRLQPDPPEGDRDTIERELKRQEKGSDAPRPETPPRDAPDPAAEPTPDP